MSKILGDDADDVVIVGDEAEDADTPRVQLPPPPEHLYGMVYAFGGRRNAPGGKVKIGGAFRNVSYDLSYLYSARMLIQTGLQERRLHDVALPATYLQRHALELAIKDAVNAVYDIAGQQDYLVALKRKVTPRRPPS